VRNDELVDLITEYKSILIIDMRREISASSLKGNILSVHPREGKWSPFVMFVDHYYVITYKANRA
jgi:hypothetical protein